ncbi:MAG: hypothetical protein A2Y88_12490 [Chloroflexi bacterium RBG_13_48_10]|nr:MAG: hypothetical protein A2Y88_12490 [Chloroflexi bacterium RBG_13_48_10]
MDQALQFFRDYEIWIYVILGVLALWQIRKFALAWEELRGAFFGLEREAAQSRVNSAATMVVLLIIMAITEFTVVTFIVPTYPGANPLPSATLNLLATPTTTLPAPTQNPNETQEATPTPGEVPAAEGCAVGQINLTSPVNGSRVSGNVTVRGSADIPNFGFYTLEIAHPGDVIWLPKQVGQESVKNNILGTWDTSSLTPGEYLLKLVVTDNVGNVLTPCTIQVTVETAP